MGRATLARAAQRGESEGAQAARGLTMGERHFSRHEAEELLPLIEAFLVEARGEKKKLEVLREELALASARIMALGGSLPPFAELAKKKEASERATARITETIARIQENGCVVKDLDEGLVDFPSLIEGREAFLCWKLGENRIGWWHGLEEGFAGRKPLDDGKSNEPPRRVQ